MPKVSEVCRHVRSKNAGPFWVTIDLSFPDRPTFDRYANASAFKPEAIGRLYEVDPQLVKVFQIPDLLVVKISYARRRPQGGMVERDMHGGQQYVQLLDVEVAELSD